MRRICKRRLSGDDADGRYTFGLAAGLIPLPNVPAVTSMWPPLTTKPPNYFPGR